MAKKDKDNEAGNEHATAANAQAAGTTSTTREGVGATTIIEFAAYPQSTSLAESQIAMYNDHRSISMAEAQHPRAAKSIMRSILEKHRNVLLFAQLPENVTDPVVMSNLWKNFVTCSRMVKKAGGDVLLHLPRHSKWWDSSAMNALRHELSVDVAYVDWCAYGVEHEGQPVDTRSCMACSNKYLLTRLVRKLSPGLQVGETLGVGGRAFASRPIVNNDLDRHYALPIEMATAISKTWRSTLAAAAYVDDPVSYTHLTLPPKA